MRPKPILLARGLEIRIDAGAAHVQSVGTGALGALVLRGVVERAPIGELMQLLEAVAGRVVVGGRVIVCSMTRAAWGRGSTAAEADLVPGHPLHPDSWQFLLAEYGFADVRVQLAGDDAYVVDATRADT